MYCLLRQEERSSVENDSAGRSNSEASCLRISNRRVAISLYQFKFLSSQQNLTEFIFYKEDIFQLSTCSSWDRHNLKSELRKIRPFFKINGKVTHLTYSLQGVILFEIFIILNIRYAKKPKRVTCCPYIAICLNVQMSSFSLAQPFPSYGEKQYFLGLP